MNYRVLCPQCSSPITYHQVFFPMMNDVGAMVIECETCKKKYEENHAKNPRSTTKKTFFAVECANPAESVVVEGGIKCESYEFDENVSKSDVFHDFPRVTFVDEEIVVPEKDYSPCSNSDCSGLPNLKCECGNSIINDAAASVRDENASIKNGCAELKQMLYQWDMHDYEKIVLNIDSSCSQCKRKFKAFYARQLKRDVDCEWNSSAFHLVSTNIPIDRTSLMGIKTKTDCMKLLKTFLARWNLIADEILVISPFIGTVYQSEKQLVDEWKWLVENCESFKTRLFTRTHTINTIRDTYASLGMDKEFTIAYGLEDELIKNYEKLNQSHAKVYAGIIGNKVEFLHGSANLVKSASSFENISYDLLDFEKFKELYMQPLQIERKRFKSFAMYIWKEEEKGYVFGENRTSGIFF